MERPLILCVRGFAMAQACGNALVMKSSGLCPAKHLGVAHAVAQALPAGG